MLTVEDCFSVDMVWLTIPESIPLAVIDPFLLPDKFPDRLWEAGSERREL